MAKTTGGDAYNLDGVANIESTTGMTQLSGGVYPMNKGNEQMDGIISVDTDASMTYTPDDAFPTGPAVPLDAVTGLPFGTGAEKRYDGLTGHVHPWPKAFE